MDFRTNEPSQSVIILLVKKKKKLEQKYLVHFFWTEKSSLVSGEIIKSCFYGKIMGKIEPSAHWENFGQGCGKKKSSKIFFSSSPQPSRIH